MGEPQPIAGIEDKRVRNGVLTALGCYCFWGASPLYWMLLDSTNCLEIIAHRIIWAFATMVLICAVSKIRFAHLFRDRRALAYLVPAALLITLNWSTYIYGVSADLILETALGYYINPLITIVFGFLFFKERMSPIQVAAAFLCAIGVLYFTFSYGSFPLVAIGLAVTFGLYSAIKKKAGYPAIQAQAVECSILVVPAIVFAIVLANITGSHGFLGSMTSEGWGITLLLIGAGPVTAIPLVLFSKSVNDIPLTLLGFIQYVSPTIGLFIGVFLNGEPFTFAHVVCFGCIWAGLALVGFDSVNRARKARGEMTGVKHELD